MSSLITLAQATGIAYATGLSAYATVALVGILVRSGWIVSPPGALHQLGSLWVIVLALVLYAVEFLSTLIPGVASAWETVHSLIRPPAAAALAAFTTWHGDPLLILIAALLGGGMAATSHTTKLGLRYAIDTSPEPVTNGVVNVGELGIVASVMLLVWQHPFITLFVALALLVAMAAIVRLIWRMLRQVFTGRWMPSCGLRQEPRASERRVLVPDLDD